MHYTCEVVSVLTTIVLGAFLFLVFTDYIRLRRWILKVIPTVPKTMDLDDVVDELLEQQTEQLTVLKGSQPAAETTDPDGGQEVKELEKKRARLAAIVAGGMAKHYLGTQMTVNKVEEMTHDEVLKQYEQYEARLGASMTKTLGASALHFYALAASLFLPIPPEAQPKLIADLEEDPFVGHALTTACCELYHRYGIFLAPLTAALTTAKHCQKPIRPQLPCCIQQIENDGRDCPGNRRKNSLSRSTSREGDSTTGTIEAE